MKTLLFLLAVTNQTGHVWVHEIYDKTLNARDHQIQFAKDKYECAKESLERDLFYLCLESKGWERVND